MAAPKRVQLIQDVLGSAHIFSSGVNDLIQERLHAISGEQLTFSQLKLLRLVSLTNSYNISDVARFLGVSNAAASKAVDRMVRRGLLERIEAVEDRRAVELSLTEEGWRLLEQYESLTGEVLEEVFARFSTEELRGIANQLDRLSISLVDRKAQDAATCFRCGIYFREKCLLRAHTSRSCHFHLHKRGNPAEDTGRDN